MKKEGLNSENAPEYLRILDEKTNRLKDLTLDLFDAAKAASGDLPVELQMIDLGSIVNQEVAEFQDVLEEKNIEIVINEQEPHIMAMADGRHLSRVLDNLLNNIKKYGMENSRAYIDITSDRILNTRKSNEDTVKSYNSDENASKSYNSNENTAKPDNGSDNNGGSDPTSGSNSQESGMLWEKAAVYRTTNQNNIYEEPNFTATDEIRKTKITIKNVSRDRLNISSDELIERFARGDSSRNTEGSGLGLAIARDLTNLMGGKFDIIIDGDLFKAEIELPSSEK
ncbi:MAG: sensor histidine kinase [Lachnospiraceae bacterium]|nr:sensor histidine kinase [Lachnospiraceae bacterium]